MTQMSSDALRNTLNQVDRERKRAMAMLVALLVMTVAFWLAMMFAKDDHSGFHLD